MHMNESQKKNRLLIIGSIVIVLVFILGYTFLRVFEAMKPQPMPRGGFEEERSVQAQIAVYQNIQNDVSGSGKLLPFAEHDIVAEASGKILAGTIELKKGTRFSKGDVIARIYDTEARLALQAKKSTFIASIIRLLPDVRIDFPQHVNRLQEYIQELSPTKRFPDFPDFNHQKLEVFFASRGISAEFYSIQQMEAGLQRYTLYAPFSGSIKEVYNEVGAFVNQGGRIARIIQTDRYDVEIPLTIEHSVWVEKGQLVQVTSAARNTNWKGRVTRIADFIDVQTQARSVFVEISHDGSLISGEFVRVNFIAEPIDSVIHVPRNVVYDSIVYVIRNRYVQEQAITSVKFGNDYALIRGVTPGDTIVVEPLVRIQKDSPVRAIINTKN